MVSYAFRDVNVLSGQVRALISGDAIDISGQVVNISGQTVVVAGGVSVSGQPIDFVSGIVIELSGLNVIANLGGVNLSLASGTQITMQSGVGVVTSVSGQVVAISGQAVYISGVVDILSGAYVNIGSGIGVIVQSGIEIVKHVPTLIKARPIVLVQSGSGGQVLSSGQIQEATIRSLDGNIYIGGTIDMPMSGVGVLIMQGDAIGIPIDDFSSIRVCSETSGHRVTFGGVY
jgi:hypothetical protein